MVEKIDKIIKVLIEFQKQNPNIYIGGSVSLILQGIIPERIPKDIDIISKEKTHIYDIFNINKNKHKRIRIKIYEGLKFELFINPKAKFIEYNYEGNILKLSPIDEVFEWKLKEKNFKIEKHKEDLEYYK
jgi:hypothetical protein